MPALDHVWQFEHVTGRVGCWRNIQTDAEEHCTLLSGSGLNIVSLMATVQCSLCDDGRAQHRISKLVICVCWIGLPLGLEAPVMTPNGVNFLFFLSFVCAGGAQTGYLLQNYVWLVVEVSPGRQYHAGMYSNNRLEQTYFLWVLLVLQH